MEGEAVFATEIHFVVGWGVIEGGGRQTVSVVSGKRLRVSAAGVP
jgi:hypothetical protein